MIGSNPAEFFCFVGEDVYTLRDHRNPNDVPEGHPSLLVPSGSRVRITRIYEDDLIEFVFAETKRIGIAHVSAFKNFEEALGGFNDTYTNSVHSSDAQANEQFDDDLSEADLMKQYEALAKPQSYSDVVKRNQPNISLNLGPLDDVGLPTMQVPATAIISQNSVADIEKPRMDNGDETVLDGAENPIQNVQAASTPKNNPILEETPLAPVKTGNPRKAKQARRNFDEVDESFSVADAEALNKLAAKMEAGFRKSNADQTQFHKNVEKQLKQLDDRVNGAESRLTEASKTFTVGHVNAIQKQIATLKDNLEKQITAHFSKAPVVNMDYSRELDSQNQDLKSQISHLQLTIAKLTEKESTNQAQIRSLNQQGGEVCPIVHYCLVLFWSARKSVLCTLLCTISAPRSEIFAYLCTVVH